MRHGNRLRTLSKARYSKRKAGRSLNFHEANGKKSKHIVARIAFSGHADVEVVFFKVVDEVIGSTLHTLVRVMNYLGMQAFLMCR